jgi:hypothetical protein
MAVIGIFQMAIKYSNIFHLKAFQNLPKLGFFIEKTISGITGGQKSGEILESIFSAEFYNQNPS